MSIRNLNRKIVGGVVVYWLLVFLLGYFLLSSGGIGLGGGNGNGNGGGNGAGGAGGGDGTGMTAEDTADGNGDGEEGNVFAGGEPEAAEEQVDSSAEIVSGEDGDGASDGAPEAAPQPGEDTFASGEAGVKAAQKKLEKAQEKNSPELYGEGVRKTDSDDSAQSKVIGLNEAQKGFFGVEASGRSTTLFLMDVSGSMATPTSERFSRLEMLKRVLINELNRLQHLAAQSELQTQVGSFVLATFSDELRVFPQSGTFSYGSGADMDMARRIVANFTAESGTSMMYAWQRLAPYLAGKNWCDVVFFLSDGEPTDCSEPELVNFLQVRLGNMPINTFSFGTHSSLMENIAKAHRGKYREIR